jgi:hypothetical protein
MYMAKHFFNHAYYREIYFMMFKCGIGPELICLSVSFSNSLETICTPLPLQSKYHEQVSTTSIVIMFFYTTLPFPFVFPV